MRKGGGKEKGRVAEVEVAKMISLWWTNGKDKDAFWRNVSSGGRVHKVASPYSGDICPVKETIKGFRLHVEVKKQEGWSFEGVIKQNKSEPLLEFIAQTVYDTSLSDRVGILLFTRNRDSWYVFLPHIWYGAPFFGDFAVHHTLLYIDPCWEVREHFKSKYKKDLQLGGYVVSWKAFSKFYTRSKLKKWLKTYSQRQKALKGKGN